MNLKSSDLAAVGGGRQAQKSATGHRTEQIYFTQNEKGPQIALACLTQLQAVRGRCHFCANGSFKEIRLCPSTGCSLYPIRFGRGQTGYNTRTAIFRYCLICGGGGSVDGLYRGSTQAVNACDRLNCPLWFFRTPQARRERLQKLKMLSLGDDFKENVFAPILHTPPKKILSKNGLQGGG